MAFMNVAYRRGETKGRFYAPGPKMTTIRKEFADRRRPLRDPYR